MNPTLAISPGNSSILSLLLKRSCSIVLMALLVWGISDYPILHAPLFLCLGAYVLILLYKPSSWLIVIPFILPLVYLAPWSGRLLFDEFDFLLLATLTASLWSGHYKPHYLKQLPTFAKWLILLVTCIYVTSFLKGFLPYTSLDTNAKTNYLSNYNSLRIFKGYFFALVFLPLWSQSFSSSQQNNSFKLLSIGTFLGLVGTGLVVLWERGVLADIINTESGYQILNSLLNFTSEYRVTGMFSDMHTGGAALDAYLMLALPFTLMSLSALYGKKFKFLGMLALLSGIYCVLATLTRTTYLAMLFVMFCIFLMHFKAVLPPENDRLDPRLTVFGMLLLISAIAIAVFSRAGSLALLSTLSAVLLGLLAPKLLALRLPHSLMIPRWLVLGVMLLAVSLFTTNQFLTSKWVSNTILQSWSFGISAVLIGFLTTFLAAKTSFSKMTMKQLAISGTLILFGLMIVVTAISGTRMNVRFNQITDDLKTRFGHWENVLTAMPGSYVDLAFGAGLGSFPQHFIISGLDNSRAGSYSYNKFEHGKYLQLGGDEDFDIGQRIKNTDASVLTLNLKARSEQTTYIRIEYCRKNIIFQHQYNPFCNKQSLKVTSPEFTPLTTTINTERINQLAWYEAYPLVLLLVNQQVGTLLDIDEVTLFDQDGNQLIRNTQFSQGGDHWFAYSDFKHLPWHEKNLALNLIFSQGFVGLLLHVVLVITVFSRLYKLHKKDTQSLFPTIIITSLIGLLITGIFDSVLDAPRIVFLFYSTVFIGFLLKISSPRTNV